jgi:S-adenosylmethionine:tRNA ribosyltransferase-isomerase
MKTSLFDYDLPERFIAQHPSEQRDASKLMVLDRRDRSITHRRFSDLTEYLGEGDALVLNNTRVIRARLYGNRLTGGKVEMLLIRPVSEGSGDEWLVMLRCRASLRDGETVRFSDALSATVLGRDSAGTSHARLICEGDLADELNRIGRTPLPPYIQRTRLADPFEGEDAERYQTVYAEAPGAVAAPTAGLHFTPELLTTVQARGCRIAPLTLHVGPGTFKPVKAESVEAHQVDQESYELPETTARIVNDARRVVAVGTTSCRVLETLADDSGNVRSGRGWTELYIYPPYRFKAVNALVTNFHLPKSSLLMLVSALATREFILAAYEEAKLHDYRFYSYGDAMLIL